MNEAIVLLAATPLPGLFYNGAMWLSEKKYTDLFGSVSSLWGIFAVLFVYAGMSGGFFFPIMLGTSALGGGLEFIRSRKKWDLIVAMVYVVVLILILSQLGGI
jgi:hypothetical protein